MTARRTDILLAALLALAAIALRAATAGTQSLWYDETFTAQIAAGRLGDVWRTVRATETTPPLSYFVAWGWAQLAGTSDFALRVPSIVFGAGTVVLGYRAGWLLAGRRAAVAVAALLATAPLLVWFGQEARAYSLMVMLAAGLTLATVRWARSAPSAWWHWSLWATLLVATQYTGWAFVAASFATIAALRLDRARHLVGAAVAPAAMALALAPLLRHQTGAGRTSWIDDTELWRRTLLFPKQLVTGLDAPAQLAAAAVLLAAVGVLFLAGARRAGLAAWLAAPVTLVMLLVGAVVGPDIVVSRNLLVLAPALFVVAGVGATRSTWAIVLTGAVTVAFVALAIVITTDGNYVRPDWHGALDYVTRDDAHAAFVVEPPLQEELASWYASDARTSSTTEALEGGGAVPPAALVGDVVPGGESIAKETYSSCAVAARFDGVTAFRC
ncbi:MAG: rane protein-like protein [Thermoleophilia bacterium]|nr:rane protein-like protein [Thermoleophilia bacterium]